ncbi:PEP-CTERM sorting domain-containing protein [Pseudoduganella sp. SL102]|uniref:PEP-CTERM sorting domain-containing protein n=1 Tax=Pseudoduganella sp. SL102 TaxID=2995154 RepID=UPI00248D0899|nr:PEP-CTERM sorting domain-containing protein [Pseudoduganella sp. SL102]WBS03999.1 PEP-CTERM sorting domain-containing protein [Pseudoduganella sp. SL102]
MKPLALLTCTAMLAVISQAASAIPLIRNGNFELGLGLPFWTVTDLPNGSGTWAADTDTVAGESGGGSGNVTVGPLQGQYYALSDQFGPGTHALTQSFTVAPNATSVMLNYSMFVNSYAPFLPNDGVLDHTGMPAQFGRVDLLTGSAGAFDTGTGVLRTFYLGIDGTPISNPNPWIGYTHDITSLVAGGGTFQLRFAETDNQLFLNMGVDMVGIEAQFGVVPEPDSLALVALGLGGLGLAHRRPNRRRVPVVKSSSR